jgi:NADH-quinone oxidoreductase subunit I
MSPHYEICNRDPLNLVLEKEDLLIEGGGQDSEYNFYQHAGIGVAQPRGTGEQEKPPVDVKSNLP